LEFAGFDVLSLANNHAFDYTAKALQDSQKRLLDAGIAPIGAGNEAQAFSPVIKNVNGTRIAFFAYTDQGPESWQAENETLGIARVSNENLDRIKADIKLAKELADVVIVSLHAGEEYSIEPNSNQTSFSRAFIDAGADLVVGSHPHVVQKSEQYKDKYIFYSLGNFVFDQNFSEKTMEGQLIEVLIEGNKIKQVVAKKIKINSSFQPELIE
jgi:poly-gamma-glutamate synthesis protein (capsule biosynthesis protein)